MMAGSEGWLVWIWASRHGVVHGLVVAVQANPASELMVLDTDALVPTLFITEVQVDRVTIEAPEGLFDL
jgi:16S rRNA processing protein RimM